MMQHLQTDILISATPQQIWDVLMDFDAFPEWNPFIRSIQGRQEVGQQLKVCIQPEGQGEVKVSPEVLVVNPGVEFRWEGKLFVKGLFDGQHHFKMEALGDHQTRFIHGEAFRGILVGPLMRMIGEATQKGFEAMNEALKNRVESLV